MLVKVREARGLSLNETARLIAVSPTTLKSWEIGKTLPRPNKLQMLAGVFGIPLLRLINCDVDALNETGDAEKLVAVEQKVQRIAEMQGALQTMINDLADDVEAMRHAVQQDRLAS